jgi:hypothetical protein
MANSAGDQLFSSVPSVDKTRKTKTKVLDVPNLLDKCLSASVTRYKPGQSRSIQSLERIKVPAALCAAMGWEPGDRPDLSRNIVAHDMVFTTPVGLIVSKDGRLSLPAKSFDQGEGAEDRIIDISVKSNKLHLKMIKKVL